MINVAAEKTFENKIKKHLENEECWFVKFFANAYTKSGIPDILACVNGTFVGIEVKAPNGKPSELQKYNVRQIMESGGIAIIIRPDQYSKFVQMIDYIFDGDLLRAERIAKEINSKWEI